MTLNPNAVRKTVSSLRHHGASDALVLWALNRLYEDSLRELKRRIYERRLALFVLRNSPLPNTLCRGTRRQRLEAHV